MRRDPQWGYRAIEVGPEAGKPSHCRTDAVLGEAMHPLIGLTYRDHGPPGYIDAGLDPVLGTGGVRLKLRTDPVVDLPVEPVCLTGLVWGYQDGPADQNPSVAVSPKDQGGHGHFVGQRLEGGDQRHSTILV